MSDLLRRSSLPVRRSDAGLRRRTPAAGCKAANRYRTRSSRRARCRDAPTSLMPKSPSSCAASRRRRSPRQRTSCRSRSMQAAAGLQGRGLCQRHRQCAHAAADRTRHAVRQQPRARQGLGGRRPRRQARGQSDRVRPRPAERPRLPQRHALHRGRHPHHQAREDRGQSRQAAAAGRGLQRPAEHPVARLALHGPRARRQALHQRRRAL